MYLSAQAANDELIHRMDAMHARMSGSAKTLFELIGEADRREACRDQGPRDMARWL